MDQPDNLILLCRVHHKLADDQQGFYSADALRILKTSHEAWVKLVLSKKEPRPIRVRRIKENVPPHLIKVTSGQALSDIVGGAFASEFGHEDPQTSEEAELIAGFLQEAKDWGELWSDLEPGQRVRAAFRLQALLDELDEAGLIVFGARETRQLEGGTSPPSPWPVAILQVARINSPKIFTVDTDS